MADNKWWPELSDQTSAEAAARQGVWAALFVAIVTGVIATISLVTKQKVLSIDPYSYIDAVIFFAVAWGIRSHSRFFAWAGLVLFIIEKIVTTRQQGSQGMASLPLAFILLLMFINGVRGVQAWHRYADNEVPVSTGHDEFENTSGMGRSHPVPDGVKGWSWGAFMWTPLWSIFNRTWIGLLSMVPMVGWIISIYIGIKGRELAWQNKHWESLEHFNAVQRRWSMSALVLVFIAVLGIGAAIVLPEYQKKVAEKHQADEAAKQETEFLNTLATRAGQINKSLPEMVDSDTRLDSVSSANRSLKYHYTLINYKAGDLDVKMLEGKLKQSIVSKTCTTADVRELMARNVPFLFAYRDKDGADLFTVTVDIAECTALARAAVPLTDKNHTYTITRPAGWVDENQPVDGADLAIVDAEHRYHAYAMQLADGRGSITDVSSLQAINLSTKLVNPVISQCMPVAKEDDSLSCDITIRGCNQYACLAYVMTTEKKGDRVVLLVGWSSQDDSEAYAPVIKGIRDSFSWAAPAADTAVSAPEPAVPAAVR